MCKSFPKIRLRTFNLQAFATKAQNIYYDDGVHDKLAALLPVGNKLVVGGKTQVQFQTSEGKPLANLLAEYPEHDVQPRWEVTKGSERVTVSEDGTISALESGDATVQGTIPGIAANTGFLFIKALGQVGVTDADGNINFDILGMVLFFGISIYINQQLTGGQTGGGSADQQQTVNKVTPILFSGMFLFFPLPAGVLMYIVVANLFQMGQTWFLMQEPLPDNIQEMVEQQEKAEKAEKGRESLPFERKRSKKKEKTSG